ncbi:MAG: 4Fe-4S dicluster domain-containing protein [Burkholderiaceae bacterium]
MTTRFKVCNCNHTMPLDAAAGAKLGAALGSGPLTVSSQLCRREIGDFLEAADGVDDVVIACTQERALFAELAQQRKSMAPLRFVNVRETGGWGKEAKQALPKMAALLAAAALPDPEPVPVVGYRSGGRTLVIGAADQALPWAARLREQLDVSVLLTAGDGGQWLGEHAFPLYSGQSVTVAGWLGAFEVRWQQHNPIDLETCTRCMACIDACPESAIDLTFQIDLDKCKDHRSCVAACGAIGAIDFARTETARSGSYDLVFDLAPTPALRMHQLPQGYFAPGLDQARQARDALRMAQLVGEFEKPRFFRYKEKLCAHGRNEKIGCNACIDVCSAEAIRGDGNHVRIEPSLCAGCGACTTVCPSGAIEYAYPRPADMGIRIKTMLDAYERAGGRQAALLLHDKEHGASVIEQTGRLAMAGGRGIPARVLPVDLHHIASAGADLWLAALAYGATNVAVLATGAEAPQYLDALQQQMEFAQAIVSGLGYPGRHFELIRAADAAQLEQALYALAPAAAPAARATFHVAADKRGTLDFAIEHLVRQAPAAPQEIALPAAAPFGTVELNTAACTLCMACVGACPESALMDSSDLPQLRFVEKNCVQCGLCEKTCPEQAITLRPRLLLTDEVRKPRVINEAQPFHCIRCAKPFGTLQMINNMTAKLALHGAFAGNLDRIKMCADCRVIDMMENKGEVSIMDVKRAH